MVTLNEALKIVVASFIASKSLKIMGKKDFADIVSLVGWLSVGVAVVTMWSNFTNKIIEFNNYISNFSISGMVDSVVNFLVG